MTVIIFEGTEKVPHTLKNDRELRQKHPEIEKWNYVLFTRCPICGSLFAANTERETCSRKCRYKLMIQNRA